MQRRNAGFRSKNNHRDHDRDHRSFLGHVLILRICFHIAFVVDVIGVIIRSSFIHIADIVHDLLGDDYIHHNDLRDHDKLHNNVDHHDNHRINHILHDDHNDHDRRNARGLSGANAVCRQRQRSDARAV